MSKALLITGATGRQGGSLINALLSRHADFEILAVTRYTSSAGAQKLLKKSNKILLVEGNLDQPETIFNNAREVTSRPIWGVYSVQALVPGASSQDAAEERQGKALIDVALKNNVRFFVYSSVDRGGDASSYDNPTPIPHFISKYNIEHHLVEATKGTEMAWTILRPVAFFDNFTPDFTGKVFTTSWKVAVKGKKLQMVATSDIGVFGALAFLNPNEYQGKSISLAGDELTLDEMAKIFKQQMGYDVPMTFGFVARILLWFMKDLGLMFKWFHDVGYGADIGKLKKMHPELKDFATWLKSESRFSS
ncbi:nucleoside-diphosphate-sugar epimerase family protein [Talaromyces proteolyticus]|uniref:Nucleoside-diphosphate-sugar epimerase family protein n=1 Tax=Talaromyces proteolyticus TaxID=1131652 RepID=A0AAD4KRE2_9EURO|nr:nucleoside-diphosphate-sugar epimerase family protein [Talaromyces proteolyticus]KAH8698750.1 nucleoside-diphosphate-sugar epimerase family protein [Talaromyces proteolyticus]